MSPNLDHILYTVGHSNHSAEHFIQLLEAHKIGAVADVRSSPYSRFNPQFNKVRLGETLNSHGIDYHWLGKELGARWEEPDYQTEGRVDFSKVSRSPVFQSGLNQLVQISETKRVALMCAEKDPLTCHRTFLVAHYAAEHFSSVRHILSDGSIETEEQANSRLLEEVGLSEDDLFSPEPERLQQAIQKRSYDIAYTN